MLLLTNFLQKEKRSLPQQLINFYGYYDLAFLDSSYKLGSEKITADMLQEIDQTTPIFDDPFMNRYLLYLYGVSHNLLRQYYGITKFNQNLFALTQEDLAALPPIFSTASTSDNEVPFSYSKTLGKKRFDSKFVPVYYLPHDFLKEKNEAVTDVLHQLKDWLK